MKDINKELKIINNEDIVWIIYLFIITFALISNNLEKIYLFNKDYTKKIIANNINSIILVVALCIYLYFTYLSYDNIKCNGNNIINEEKLIVNILFVIAGIIAIHADINSKNISLAI